VLGGYEKKKFKNRAGFPTGFQVGYLKVLPKVIPFLNPVHHRFSLDWEPVTWNPVFTVFILKNIYQGIKK
jgi:hypothetical protein